MYDLQSERMYSGILLSLDVWGVLYGMLPIGGRTNLEVR